MQRREFIAALAGTAVWPLGARAQQAATPVIGFLHGGSVAAFTQQMLAFHEGLRGAGYVEGQNVTIEYRWADNREDQLPTLAADLIRRRVAVIVALGGNSPALAAKALTATIPIVFNTGADPVRTGLVASLNRPGGNVTGVSFLVEQLGAKGLGLLHELVPNATAIALLVNPNNPNVSGQIAIVQAASRALGIQLHVVNTTQTNDLDKAFASMLESRVGALILGADPLFATESAQIIQLSARFRIPTMYYRREFADAGGLMSYGTSASEAYRQVGTYAARILNGAKPSDLPVMQVVKFEFVLNLKTAKSLGIEVPADLSARADEAIE